MEPRQYLKESSLILVVNDEPVLRDLFRFNFQVRGYGVIDISGGPEVMNIVENKSPDLTILDLMVGEVDGFELCRRICSSSNSRVIAFNMRSGDSDLFKCLEMGVDDYLGRPFGVDELMTRVRAVLGRRQLKRSKQPVNIVSGSEN